MKRRRLLLFLGIAAAALAVGAFAAVFFPGPRVRAINALLHVQARIAPQSLLARQQSLDGWVPAGSVLLVGDSIIAMVPAHAVDPLAINFGIGGANTTTAGRQFETLDCVRRARAVVLHVGTNDVAANNDPAGLAQALQKLPPTLPVLLCTIPPIDPAVHRDRTLSRIAEMNRTWIAEAARRPNTLLVRVETVLADEHGALRRDLHQGDGLHLNAEGNRRFAALLRATLAQVPAR